MQIKTKKLKELAIKLAKSIVENERIKEMNSTGSVGGSYMTPMAFSNSEKNRKKLLKKALKQVGYKQVSEVKLNEELTEKDVKRMKILIKDTIADVLRDIWLKRTAWKK